MTKGNIHTRLERLEARTPTLATPAQHSQHRQKMLDSLDQLAAWRRAGSPDNEEGRELQEFAEAVRRQAAKRRGEGYKL